MKNLTAEACSYWCQIMYRLHKIWWPIVCVRYVARYRSSFGSRGFLIQQQIRVYSCQNSFVLRIEYHLQNDFHRISLLRQAYARQSGAKQCQLQSSARFSSTNTYISQYQNSPEFSPTRCRARKKPRPYSRPKNPYSRQKNPNSA